MSYTQEEINEIQALLLADIAKKLPGINQLTIKLKDKDVIVSYFARRRFNTFFFYAISPEMAVDDQITLEDNIKFSWDNTPEDVDL